MPCSRSVRPFASRVGRTAGSLTDVLVACYSGAHTQRRLLLRMLQTWRGNATMLQPTSRVQTLKHIARKIVAGLIQACLGRRNQMFDAKSMYENPRTLGGAHVAIHLRFILTLVQMVQLTSKSV